MEVQVSVKPEPVPAAAIQFNDFDQPIGLPVPGWTPPPAPPRKPMIGRLVRLEPMHPGRHADALDAANRLAPDDRSWTYLPLGPFPTPESYRRWMEDAYRGDDPLFFAIVDQAANRPVGMAAYLRIMPAAGSIEVGAIHYSPLLAGTAGATEAMYLMMKRAFELGYRRYEWKCDSLNAPSRAAARRLGFTYEGTFRQAAVYKGRTRDTAWFSVVDSEWPKLRERLERWLDPGNFDAEGRQRSRLSELTSASTTGRPAG
jgi:RimJ/RimL family protein N-acetyltransferase